MEEHVTQEGELREEPSGQEINTPTCHIYKDM